MNSIFNIDKINERLKSLEDFPPFEPEKFEPTFTVTQLFETGIEATLYFVIRNGEMIFYKATQRHEIK